MYTKVHHWFILSWFNPLLFLHSTIVVPKLTIITNYHIYSVIVKDYSCHILNKIKLGIALESVLTKRQRTPLFGTCRCCLMLQHLLVTCHCNANTQQPLPGTSVERERKRNVESRRWVPFIATRGAAGLSNQEGRNSQWLVEGRR